jgi:outer membrane autotransporter protein
LLAGTTEETNAWQGGVSLRLDGSLSNGAIAPYVALSYMTDLDGGNEVAMGTAIVTADTASALFGARAGLNARVADRVVLFVGAGLVEGLDNDVTGYDGQAGLKVHW